MLIFSFLFVLCVGPSSGKVENEVKDSVGLEANGKYREIQPGRKTDELHMES